MKSRGPILTLVAVLALGLGILIVNMTLFSRSESSDPPAAAETETAEPTAETVETTPAEASPEPEEDAPGFPAEGMYVIEMPSEQGPLVLGIAVEDDAAIAYACDGADVEIWLRGEVTGDSLELTGRDNSSVTGSYFNGAVDGVFALADQEWDFIAEAQSPPAALYAFGTDTRVSWIVQQDGSVTGVQRNPDGSTEPAPALDPDGTAIINGQTVQASLITGADEIP
ncbi:hypothetical protein [Hoyosella altamirensis]|uniref:Uncharacterized protein n=1 Tax=Hoyosella altamirensis TaxID=616997 RepID=A0A839RKJ7_9ACTN|nr:hypothetical protein [Hoyosella altamirensis]MBB3036748.1 hypothetical protein [Hoyosella altamirensis]